MNTFSDSSAIFRNPKCKNDFFVSIGPEGGRSCSALIGLNSILGTLFPPQKHSSLCSRRLPLNRNEQNLTF